MRKLFNIKTEKLHTLCQPEKKDKEENNDDNKDDGPPGMNSSDRPDGEKKKGHGRIGVNQYKKARRIRISHESLKPGDIYPDCKKGKLYKIGVIGGFISLLWKIEIPGQ
ncbi:MAG: hypothetical protein JXB88_07340 [Spirochaetales bacterium]|nr:hypothetical protein [Spirochaetales bacterium]